MFCKKLEYYVDFIGLNVFVHKFRTVFYKVLVGL